MPFLEALLLKKPRKWHTLINLGLSSILFPRYLIISLFQVILLNSTMQKENQMTIRLAYMDGSPIQEARNLQKQAEKDIGNYLNELLSLQIQVNRTLLINSILTDQFIKQADQSNGKNSSSEGSTLVSGKERVACNNIEKRPHHQIVHQTRKKRRPPVRHENQKSESQYEPSQENQNQIQYKLSESKNVPKNYGKSILSFIKKNNHIIHKVLNEFGVDALIFHAFLAKFKNSINTIAELRSLWIDSLANQFAKVLRIISWQYLRKHSLGHIFNSRVENYAKHIKYRQKILKAIQKPQEFTQMKDF